MSGMPFRPEAVETAEVLVIGSGTAGLMAAICARGRSVTILSKTPFGEGGSGYLAQGGIAAALGHDDAPDHHARDTIAAGAGLCDLEVVQRVTSEAPELIRDLQALGARFDVDRNGALALGREGAHCRNRIAHAAGDSTGRELVRALAHAVRASSRIDVHDEVLALDLVLDRGNICGVAAVDRSGRHVLYVVSEVVLASGGIGHLWRHTTNPREVSADGLAMAIRVGARTADLEFIQFHPTALAVGTSPMPLLTEALRGEGAVLIDRSGRRFMHEVHPLAELAPRDVVALALWRKIEEGDDVFLDATRLDGDFGLGFPTVARLCRAHGFDPARDPLPVAPAAHYHMGGIVVDHRGATTIPGLWACGEVARTGLHGGNRLASNSLLETLVYGRAVGEALTAAARPPAHPVRARDATGRHCPVVAGHPWRGPATPAELEAEEALRDIMWRGVGLERNAAGLQRADRDLADVVSRLAAGVSEVRNMAVVARLVVKAAATRTESRGAHFRSDTPSSSACWRQAVYFDGDQLVLPRPITVDSVSA